MLKERIDDMTVHITPVVAWTIYGIGVVVFPILVGAMFKEKKFSVMDDGVPVFFLSLTWPIVIFLVAIVWSVMVACFIPGWVWNGLLHIGSEIGWRYGMWKEVRNAKKKAKERERKEREEREHAERVLNAKLGKDKEYFDYVCD